MTSKMQSKVTIHFKGEDRCLNIDKPRYIIGRAQSVDVVIADDLLSRKHLEVKLVNGATWIRDLGSLNGTWLDGIKLLPNILVELRSGQVISLGGEDAITLRIEHGEVIDVPVAIESRFKVVGGEDVVIPRTASKSSKPQISPERPPALQQVPPSRTQNEQDVLEQIKRLIHTQSDELLERSRQEAQNFLEKAKLSAKKLAVEADEKIAKKIQNLDVAEYESMLKRDEARRDEQEARKELERVKKESSAELARITQERLRLSQQMQDLKLQEQELVAGFQKLSEDERTSAERIEGRLQEAQAKILKLEEEGRELEVQTQRSKKISSDKIDEANLLLSRILGEVAAAREENLKLGADTRVLMSEYRETVSSLEKTAQSKRLMSEELDRMNAELKQASLSMASLREERLHAQKEIEQEKLNLFVLRDELSQKEKTLTERQRKVDEDVASRLSAASEEAQKIQDQSRDSAERMISVAQAELQLILKKQEESKSEFERVKAELIRRVNATQEEINATLAKGKEESDQLRALAQSEAEAQKISLQEELKKQKAKQESALAQLHQVEMGKIKDLRKKSEEDWEAAKQDRAQAMSSNLYALVYSELLKVRSKTLDETIIDGFSNQLREVILDTMLDRSGADSDRLQQILKTSINSKEKEKVYWRRAGYGAAAFAFCGLLLIAFPSLYSYPWGLIRAAFSEKSTEMADDYAHKQLAEAKERFVFNPPTTSEHKESYVDNILYTTDFLAKRADAQFQDKWILELNDFFINQLDVKDTTIIKFVSLEANLLQDLAKLKTQVDPNSPEQKIEEMRSRELDFKDKLAKTFGDPEKVTQFYDYSASFWRQMYEAKSVQKKN